MASADEEEVARLTRAWVAGWRTSADRPFTIGDVAPLYDHGPGLTSFDFVGPAGGLSGWDACAREYAGFMAGLGSWSLALLSGPRVTVLGDAAWSTVVVRGEGVLTGGQAVAFDGRATLVWARRAVGWKIVHEHASAPMPGA